MNTNRVHEHMPTPEGLKVTWDHLRHIPPFLFRLTRCRRQHQLEKHVWKKQQQGGLTLPVVLWQEHRNLERQEGWYIQANGRGLTKIVGFHRLDRKRQDGMQYILPLNGNFPSVTNACADFWCGFAPYLNDILWTDPASCSSESSAEAYCSLKYPLIASSYWAVISKALSANLLLKPWLTSPLINDSKNSL